MIVYNVSVPLFEGEERVEFTVETKRVVITFLCEWWDGLWHFSTTINNENKRSGVIYPNILYFPKDRVFSFKTVSTKSNIGFIDLPGLELIVAVGDSISETGSITQEATDSSIPSPVTGILGSAAYKNIGTGLDQVPLNRYLGSAAYNSKDTIVNEAVASVTPYVESVYLENTDPVSVASMIVGGIRTLWRLAAYDGNALAVSPPSGATIEGLASVSLYGQYSYLTLERVSETLFVIKGLEDRYEPSVNTLVKRSGRHVTVDYRHTFSSNLASAITGLYVSPVRNLTDFEGVTTSIFKNFSKTVTQITLFHASDGSGTFGAFPISGDSATRNAVRFRIAAALTKSGCTFIVDISISGEAA